MWLYKMNETIQQKPQLLVPVFLLVTNDQIEQKEKKKIETVPVWRWLNWPSRGIYKALFSFSKYNTAFHARQSPVTGIVCVFFSVFFFFFFLFRFDSSFHPPRPSLSLATKSYYVWPVLFLFSSSFSLYWDAVTTSQRKLPTTLEKNKKHEGQF